MAPNHIWGVAHLVGAPAGLHRGTVPFLPEASLHQVLVALTISIVVAAVLAESAWLVTRRGAEQVLDLATTGAMAVGSMVTAAAFTSAYVALWPVIGRCAPGRLVELTGTNVVIEVAIVFVAWDAAGYAHHWLGHRTRVGWASHQVHHTGSHYDMTLAWRQSWLPLPALITFPLVALTGGSLAAALGCAAVSNLWQALHHTSIGICAPRWFAACVITPAAHRRHHVDGGPVNLGPVLTIWDRLGGTWLGHDRARASLPAAAGSRNPVVLETAGWRALLGSR